MIKADLHSHILPAIDDGAKTPEISLDILRQEAEQGVKQIVFTPHFDPGKESVWDFISRRDCAVASLDKALVSTDLSDHFSFYYGAEIRYSPALTDLPDLDALCITGTKVLLIEFSFQQRPEFIRDVFYRLQLQGYILLMAHVERFPWLRKDPALLYDLVNGGAFAQFNADPMLKHKEIQSFVRKMLECGLLHGIGSDTHDPEDRPPRLREAEKQLNSFDSDRIDMINRFSTELLSGLIPMTETPVKPRKSFWDLLKK